MVCNHFGRNDNDTQLCTCTTVSRTIWFTSFDHIHLDLPNIDLIIDTTTKFGYSSILLLPKEALVIRAFITLAFNPDSLRSLTILWILQQMAPKDTSLF